MANFFLDSVGGSNTSPYDTWAKAANAIATLISHPIAAGDRIFMEDNHAEAFAGNTTLTFPGTDAAPNTIVSASSADSSYSKASAAQFDAATSGLFDLTIRGHVFMYGVYLEAGDDMFFDGSSQKIILDDSTIELGRVGGTSLVLGSSSGQSEMIFKNGTVINFSGGGSSNTISLVTTTRLYWQDGTLSWAGTMPDLVFTSADRNNYCQLTGVDLSAITSGALFDLSKQSSQICEVRNCLISSGLSLTTGTPADSGSRIMMSGVDDTTGNDLYRFEYVDFYGSIVHDDAVYRDSGASDGTTNISWKMVTTANATEFFEPLISPPIPGWASSTGSKTFTVSFVRDSGTDLQDNDIWVEVEYPGTAANTNSSFANDGLADPLASFVDQTNNTETWTGTGGFGSVTKQELSVTVTVNRVGPVRARVHLAKPSTTVYLDPKIEIT